jgi:hypothetical protein
MAKNTPKKDYRLSTIFEDIKENISEGAQTIGKKTSDLLEDIKEKAEELYEAGSEKYEQAAGTVQGYIDQYQNDREIKSLQKEKTILYTRFGDILYHEFKKNGTISKRFLTTKKMSELTGEIESIDKKILKQGRSLDKKKS